MTDKEQIIDKLYGALVGVFLMYNISPESITGQTIFNLLKEVEEQLASKTRECIKLNDKIIDMNSVIEDAAINLGNKDFTLYDLPFEIKKLKQDLFLARNQITLKNEYIQKVKQECEELKNTLKKLTRGVVMPTQEPEVINLTDRYRKALEEIEDIAVKNNITEFDFGGCTDLLKIIVNFAKDYGDVLDIINKAKGKDNV